MIKAGSAAHAVSSSRSSSAHVVVGRVDVVIVGLDHSGSSSVVHAETVALEK